MRDGRWVSEGKGEEREGLVTWREELRREGREPGRFASSMSLSMFSSGTVREEEEWEGRGEGDRVVERAVGTLGWEILF